PARCPDTCGMPRTPEQSAADAIIGRALRRSLWLAGAGLAVALGIFLWRQSDDSIRTQSKTPLTSPEVRRARTAEVPMAEFADITAESGLKFAHVNGAYGEKLLPETMGGGVAF